MIVNKNSNQSQPLKHVVYIMNDGQLIWRSSTI